MTISILDKDEFISRVRKLIGTKSIRQFADECDLPYGTINSILNGSLPSVDRAAKIAKGGNVTSDWLLFGTEMPIEINDVAVVPRYDVRASAGTGTLVVDDYMNGQMAFTRQWLRSIVRNVEAAAIIEAQGDSMLKPPGDGIADGDLLLVDTSIIDFEGNGIYIIDINGKIFVKRLQRMLDGSITVLSDNPAYKPEVVESDKIDELRLLGRVFWHGRHIL